MELQELQQRSWKTADEHGWHDRERSVGDRIALAHSEISEAYNAFETHRLKEWFREDGKPEGFYYEIADAWIRLADTCGELDIELQSAVCRRMYILAPSGLMLPTPNTVTNLHIAAYNMNGLYSGVESRLDRERRVERGINIAHLNLSNALEAYRSDGLSFTTDGKYGFRHMIAQVFIDLADLVMDLGTDLTTYLEDKMEFNEGRSFRHGDKNL